MKKLTIRFPFAIFCIPVFFSLLTISCSKHADVNARLTVNPDADTIGATVTITGGNFDPTNNRDTVIFNAPAGFYLYNSNARIISVSSSQLTVIVPAIALSGPVKVKVGTMVYSTSTRQFYTQLGFSSLHPNNDPKLASFLFGDNGFVIHFFQQGSKIDEYLEPRLNTASEIIFTLSAETEAEVNEWAERVKNAGGDFFQKVRRDENNYYGFAFADPDGHKFNVLLMDNM